MKARIQFDGGCSPNPGNKYGSFNITLDDAFQLQRHRFTLGFGTNNEAEFESLIAGIEELRKATTRAQTDPSQIQVHIVTDSTIVRNWLQRFEKFKPEKCKEARRLAMAALAGKCVALLKDFQSFTVEWNGRENNVAAFGH